MERTLQLAQPGRATPCYPRRDVKQDALYNYYRFREVNMTVSKKLKRATKVTDTLAEQLRKDGLISPQQKQAYDTQLLESFSRIEDFDGHSPEQIYQHVHAVRKAIFGAAALDAAQTRRARQGIVFDPVGGIDQTAKKEALVASSDAVIVALCQAELFARMRTDLEKAQRQGKEIWLVCGQPGDELPSRQLLTQWLGDCTGIRFLEREADGLAWDGKLQTHIDREQACLLVYGEEGLLDCRGLLLDAVVTAVPAGYHAQAVTNLLGCKAACVVYVPKGMDITQHVELTQKTRLTYWHLAKLWHTYGDCVYACTAEELYRRYGQYFVNIYDNGTGRPEAFPVQVTLPQTGEPVYSQFDRQLDENLAQYLGSFDSIQFQSAYFDKTLTRQPICYDAAQKQDGILVQAVRVKKAEGAQILRCEKDVTPRQMFRNLGIPGTGLVSNFLFFLTPKLGALYNDLRADRPREQADAASGHLDYMLSYRDGKRIETFPLFRKTCIAMKEDGQFLFFNYRLGGGSVRISDLELRWTADQVDTDTQAPVRVYTPYYSLPDRNGDRDTYRKFVGEGRVNLVILQDKLCSVRRGDVILPSVGVVISLTEDAAKPLLSRLTPLEDGYYDVSGLSLTVLLDGPPEIAPEDWARVRWAYGGGLSLILDGVGLCDGDHTDSWFEAEGWMSPLSRQTQESNLHSLVKHPRTAIGTAENGDLVILVYSGRTWRSAGADYSEMIRITRQLFPDIRTLMNVDGGGSAMLGMVANGSFLELSCPSTSAGSCAGQVRPINTVFYIPAGERKQI